MAIAIATAVSSARAEPLPREKLAQAKHHFQLGVAAYDSGQYEVALREFQQSHALSHSPALYFNMAACEEKTDHYSAAALLLRQYLLERPDAEDKLEVERRIKSLDERGESIKRGSPEPSPLPRSEAPVPRPRIISWALLGATAVFGVTAIGTGVSTIVTHDRLERGCGATALGCSASERGGLRARALATDVMIGLAAAAAVATVVMFIVEPRLGQPKKGAQRWDATGFHF